MTGVAKPSGSLKPATDNGRSGSRRKRLGELLIDAGLIDDKTLADALAAQRVQDKKLGEILVDMGIVSDEAIAEAIAVQLNIPLIRIADTPIPADVLAKVPPELADKYDLVPIEVENGQLVVAMANPLVPGAVDDLRFVTGMPVVVAVSPMADIKKALRAYYPKEDIQPIVDLPRSDLPDIDIIPAERTEEAADAELESLASQAPVIRFTNTVLADAIRLRASDVHIEPQKSGNDRPALVIRCRVDGVMRETLRTARNLHPSLISRLKVMAGMDIAVRRRPQDGKAQVKYGGETFDLRISTIPTTDGEKVTIRVLNPATAQMLPEDLGLSKPDLSKLMDAIATPQGMVLVTGPTGSGKSSTLYACLNRLNTPEVNIITVEDPVEFDVPGINQVQINVKAGISFAAGLRSILRQDPDIVMVGEVRDRETAEIAFQAAQTGHLVLSTLHTNDAPSAVVRLVDLGVDAFQISGALVAVIGQRLVRRIHTPCRVADAPDARRLARIRPYLDGDALPGFHKGAGCEACFGTGYTGRLGLFEILLMTPSLRSLVTPTVSAGALKTAAVQEGFRALSQDGILKAARGQTSLDEVFRAAPPELLAAGATPVPPPRTLPSLSLRHAAPRPSSAGGPAPLTEPVAFSHDEKDDAPLVLVVEDNEIVRLTICDTLEGEDYNVMAAEDGVEAMDVLGTDTPDLIITDYMMPRMDGVALIEKIRGDAGLKDIPVLMLTAKDDAESAVVVMKAGANEFMTKPVNRARFLTRVRNLLAPLAPIGAKLN